MKLLEVIFDDGIMEPAERDRLAEFTQSMDKTVVLDVFKKFVAAKWGEVISDDVVTRTEWRLLGHIVLELELKLEDLPHQARMALKDRL
jgi:hypothetical protein